MSEQVMVDPQALAQHLVGLEKYIENLRGAIAIARDKLSKTREAREALRGLGEYGDKELLVSIDPMGNAFFKARRIEGERPIVHLGLNVYAEIPFEEAEKILVAKEHIYLREIQALEKELEKKAEEYQRLQALLAALQRQALSRQG